MIDPQAFANLRFEDAATQYCDSRTDLRPSSLAMLRHHAKQAGKFFGKLPLQQIHVGHLSDYQQARKENRDGLWQRKARASIINHEISLVQSVLKRAPVEGGRTLWDRVAPWYRPLPTPATKTAKTLSDEDEMLFFGVMADEKQTELFYWVTSITNNTGASGSELRTLRLRDVKIGARIPYFEVREEVAKNEYRERKVVMNPTAVKQMTRCLMRARELGSELPDHFVFPLRDRHKQKYDPTRPASSSWLQKQMTKARTMTGIQITPHCFRHQHITLSMEAGENPELIAKRVGHSKINMTRYYTHTRANSAQKAVNAIDPSVRFGPSALRNGRVRPPGKKKSA